LRWLDPPPAAAVEEARARCSRSARSTIRGGPSAHGRAIAALPLPPRLAHMLIAAEARGWGEAAAQVAVLLSERGLGGNEADLEVRLRRWRSDRGKRAEAARGLAKRWLLLTRSSRANASGAGTESSPAPLDERGSSAAEVGPCVALAFPDRVSRRRDASGENWISAGGRGFRLDPTSPLAREAWLAVAEVGGTAGGARILSAAPIAEAEVERLFADRIHDRAELSFDPKSGTVRARRGRRLGAILLSEGSDAQATPAEIEAALLDGVRAHGLDLLPWGEGARSLRRRAAFAAASIRRCPICRTKRLRPRSTTGFRCCSRASGACPTSIPARSPARSTPCSAMKGGGPVERLAPASFITPAGSAHAIDYGAEAGPTVTARVQALFGLAEHPAVANGRVPLVLALTSPAGRPIQTTRDLPGFWAGSWAAVAKEMRGRYPRHPWPEDPTRADPTLRTKKATARQGSG
jgi:ATP-dependent helicase HrpB